MQIEKLSILNFKNIEEAELLFSPKMNCLFGNNGMGKTNLLDALYYLSFTRNHTHLPDSQLIRHAADFMVLQGDYVEGDTHENIYCGIKRGTRKVFKRNKKEYERLSEHLGLLPLVMISPADTDLITGGSEERRKWVDMVISQYDRDYLRVLIHYNKALFQRNSLLKSLKHSSAIESQRELFEILEEQLVMLGEELSAKRRAFVEKFEPVFQRFHRQIAQEQEQVGLSYETHLSEGEFGAKLAERRERDLLLGYTSFGPHKDDYHFRLGDHFIRKIGSQGQNKTYLIALKLAQFRYLVENGLSVPILLLDDIFDKLDARRVEQIIQLVAGKDFGQIFITDTNRKYLDEILQQLDNDYKLFQVEEGQINELP